MAPKQFNCKACGAAKNAAASKCPNIACSTRITITATTPPESPAKQQKTLSDEDLEQMQEQLDKKSETDAILEVTAERDEAVKELAKYKQLYRELMQKNAKTNGELDAANKRIEKLSAFISKNFQERMAE